MLGSFLWRIFNYLQEILFINILVFKIFAQLNKVKIIFNDIIIFFFILFGFL